MLLVEEVEVEMEALPASLPTAYQTALENQLEDMVMATQGWSVPQLILLQSDLADALSQRGNGSLRQMTPADFCTVSFEHVEC